jgi:hypothetical protein
MNSYNSNLLTRHNGAAMEIIGIAGGEVEEVNTVYRGPNRAS